MPETQHSVFGSSKSKGSLWTQGEADFLHLICAGFSHIQEPSQRQGFSPHTSMGKLFPTGLLRAQHCPFPQTSDGNSITPQLHCSQECALSADILLRLTFHASHSLINITRANSQETEPLVALILLSTLYLKQNKECKTQYKTKTTCCCSPLSFLFTPLRFCSN